MSNKRSVRWALFIALLIVAFARIPSVYDCLACHEYQAQNYNFAHRCVIFVGAYLLCGGNWFHQYESGISVAATIAIACFTWTLWDATNRQVEFTKAALEETRKSADAAVAVSMAHVYMRGVELEGLIEVLNTDPVANPIFKYCFTNYGKTLAFLTEFCINRFIGKALPAVPNYRQPILLDKQVVVPAEKDSPTFDNDWHTIFGEYFQQQAFEPIRQGADRLYIYGYFGYRDVFETQYKVGFAFGFDRRIVPLVFTARDTPTYVYRKKEDAKP